MRNSIGLNNNPSPNASTGFKLTTGNAYRKLDQSWPIYQPIDGTKHGKGKDSNGWNSEENTAAGDAPIVSRSGSSSSNKFTKYLNTKQALERIGILFDGTKARNVITQLYYASTSKLAVTNDHVVVMGNSFLPSLWYWVVDRSATTDSSSKPTWFANTTLNWGEDKQKQFVENQLGYKETIQHPIPTTSIPNLSPNLHISSVALTLSMIKSSSVVLKRAAWGMIVVVVVVPKTKHLLDQLLLA